MLNQLSHFDGKGFKYSVDMWDGDIRRYQLDDEDIGGIRCYQSFKGAKDYAISKLEQQVSIKLEKLDKLRELKASGVV